MADPSPVYLVTGDDDLLVQRESEKLLQRLAGEISDLDVQHVDVLTTDRLPEMRTASLFGGTRCIVLRDAAGLTGTLADDVAAYLDEPSPEAILVLVARGTGRIRGLATRAKKVGERIDVKMPAPWADREWAELVRDELRRAGRKADPAAVAALLDRAGTDPGMIATRSAQVAAASPGEMITVDDVERVIEAHGNQGAFAIADAVAERDPGTAIVALRGALEAGESPLALLGAIIFRLRQLLQVRAGMSAKEAGISAGQYRHLQAAARRFRPGELAWCHDRAARADLDLKGSDLPHELVAEVAVAELATSRDVGPPWNPAR